MDPAAQDTESLAPITMSAQAAATHGEKQAAGKTRKRKAKSGSSSDKGKQGDQHSGSASTSKGTLTAVAPKPPRPDLVGHIGDFFTVKNSGRPVLVKVIDNTLEDSGNGLTTIQFMRSYESKKHTISVADRKYYPSWTDADYKEVWSARKPRDHIITSGYITQAEVLTGPFELSGRCIPQAIIDRTEKEVLRLSGKPGNSVMDTKIL